MIGFKDDVVPATFRSRWDVVPLVFWFTNQSRTAALLAEHMAEAVDFTLA